MTVFITPKTHHTKWTLFSFSTDIIVLTLKVILHDLAKDKVVLVHPH